MFDCEESPNGEVEKCVPDKFKLDLEDSIVIKNYGVRAYRIVALYSFNTPLGRVEAGDKGGYISEECNLCQHGSCWVWNNATVSGNAEIKDDAQVYEYARIGGNAVVSGNSRVHGRAIVRDDSYIFNWAEVYDDAQVRENSSVSDYSVVKGAAIIIDTSVSSISCLYGVGTIRGSKIRSSELMSVNIMVGSTLMDSYVKSTVIKSPVCIIHGVIQSQNDFITIGPIGSRSDTTTFNIGRRNPAGNLQIVVCTGCFFGGIEDFERAVTWKYSDPDNAHRKNYLNAIAMAKTKLEPVLKSYCVDTESKYSKDLFNAKKMDKLDKLSK